MLLTSTRLKQLRECAEACLTAPENDESWDHFLEAFDPPTSLELLDAIEKARKILALVSGHGPEDGPFEKHTACAFCDMGGAGTPAPSRPLFKIK